jgi:hypothetical protein
MFVSFPHTNGFLFFFTFKGSEWAENNITTSSLSSGGNLSSSFCITSTKAYKPEMKRLHEKHLYIQYHNIISVFWWKSIKFLVYNIYKSLQIKAEKYYTWETCTYIYIQYHNIISMFWWKSIKFLLYNIYKSLQIKAEKYYTWETGTYTSVKPVWNYFLCSE